MINEERALARIREAERSMADYKRKVYRLRRIVAGDKEALFSEGVGENADTGEDAARRFNDVSPAILLQQFEEGRNNDLLNYLGTLVESTCYYFPKIEVQGLSPHLQVVHSQYLERTLKACNAIHHNKIQIWDHMMGGMGDIYLSTERGRPTVRWADSLDIKFDQTARLVCDVKWKSITVVETLDEWISIFGRDAFSEFLSGRKDDDSKPALDMPFELEFYYDVNTQRDKEGQVKEGGLGSYMVFIKEASNSYSEKPIYKGENPNFFQVQGDKEPYLPFESLFYTALPSIRLPIGAAEKALPAQIAVWRAAKRIQDIIDSGPAFYEVADEAMSEEQKETFQEAIIGGMVKVKQLGGIKAHEPLPITSTDVEEMNRNQQELKQQLGTNNYQLGAPEKGIKYAREVNAVRADGALAAGSLSKDNSDCWGRFLPKYVGKAKLYDRRPITFPVDGVDYEFGPHDPIGDYLRPDAIFVCSEDTFKFIPQQVKVAQADHVLDRALQLAQQFPGAVSPAYRKFLEANGVDNIEERMKQPQPQGQPQQGGAPGQQQLNPQLSQEAVTA